MPSITSPRADIANPVDDLIQVEPGAIGPMQMRDCDEPGPFVDRIKQCGIPGVGSIFCCTAW